MSVLESSRRAPGVYERKVVMHVRGEEIMQAAQHAPLLPHGLASIPSVSRPISPYLAASLA